MKPRKFIVSLILVLVACLATATPVSATAPSESITTSSSFVVPDDSVLLLDISNSFGPDDESRRDALLQREAPNYGSSIRFDSYICLYDAKQYTYAGKQNSCILQAIRLFAEAGIERIGVITDAEQFPVFELDASSLPEALCIDIFVIDDDMSSEQLSFVDNLSSAMTETTSTLRYQLYSGLTTTLFDNYRQKTVESTEKIEWREIETIRFVCVVPDDAPEIPHEHCAWCGCGWACINFAVLLILSLIHHLLSKGRKSERAFANACKKAELIAIDESGSMAFDAVRLAKIALRKKMPNRTVLGFSDRICPIQDVSDIKPGGGTDGQALLQEAASRDTKVLVLASDLEFNLEPELGLRFDEVILYLPQGRYNRRNLQIISAMAEKLDIIEA